MSVLGVEKLLLPHQAPKPAALPHPPAHAPLTTQGVAAGAGNLDSLSALASRISTSL